MKTVAIVPMRHTSARVPGKNYRDFAGKPLYHHIIESLLACADITEVVIDTDSDTIMEDAAKNFPNVKVLERPENLRKETTSMNAVLLHTVSQVEADYYLQTHSTNPLLRPETIAQAMKEFFARQDEYDSLFTVTRLQTRLYDAHHKAMNHDPGVLLRTQDLPPVYEENSCLYLFTKEILEQRKNRIGERPLLFEIPKEEAWDIDEEIDFRVSEFLHASYA